MKVKVCKKCSNLDIDKLEKLSKKYDFKLKTGCIGKCDKGQTKTSFAYIGDKFIKEKDSEDIYKKIKKKAKKDKGK